jgi:hypothetical protein
MSLAGCINVCDNRVQFSMPLFERTLFSFCHSDMISCLQPIKVQMKPCGFEKTLICNQEA